MRRTRSARGKNSARRGSVRQTSSRSRKTRIRRGSARTRGSSAPRRGYHREGQCSVEAFCSSVYPSHSSATGVFWLNCRVVYFRFGAEMTYASSKMYVRRLKVGYLLIQILVHCALVCLVFFVRSRSASQCVHGCRKASMRQFPMNALRKTPVTSLC